MPLLLDILSVSEGPLFVVYALRNTLILHYMVTNRLTVSMKADCSSMKGM
jgi:hypothetical protein